MKAPSFRITAKCSLILAFGVLFCALAVFFVSSTLMKKGFGHVTHEKLTTAQNVVNGEYAKTIERFSKYGRLFATSQEAADAFASGDHATLRRFAQHAKETADAGFVTLTDAKGDVVARAGSDKKGDSIATNALVSVAMTGQQKSDLVKMKNNGLSIGCAAPVKIEGKIVGVILFGEGFRSNAFVDGVKKICGLEVTVFDGDERVSTTIMNNGNRAVGTKLNNQAVEAAVLNSGGQFDAEANIFGKSYKTIYWPLKNIEGKPIGIWFIGASSEVADNTVNDIIFWVLMTVICVIVIVNLFGFFAFRSFTKPLKKTVDYSVAVAKGNLDAALEVDHKRRDEVGDLSKALHSMVKVLKGKISEAEKAVADAKEKGEQAEKAAAQAAAAAKKAEAAKSEGMHAAAGQLENVVVAMSEAVERLAEQVNRSGKSAEESSARLSEAATAMNEMNSTVQEVARNASSAATVSGETRSNAEEGQKILSSAMASIAEVQKVSLALKEDMGTLHEHTQNISKIMNVISDIADQTNLLALNAAIEAARAGEAGRGFAVVADEVRKLAEKTMASTNDVSNAIKAIQGSAQQSVDRMEEALGNVEQATTLAQQSGEALQQIVANVEETADQVRAIATASEEQSASSEEINQSISTVDSMSAQTTEAMGEASAAVAELETQTQTLNGLIEKMKNA